MCQWARLAFGSLPVMVGWEGAREVPMSVAAAFAARTDVQRIALTPEVAAYVGPDDRVAYVVAEVAVPTEGLRLLGFAFPVPRLAAGATRFTPRMEMIEVSPGLPCSNGW